MPCTTFTESVVEQAALAWLDGLGYPTLSGPEIAPGEPAAERDDYGQVILERRLRRALQRLNPQVPADALEEAFRKLTRPDSPSLARQITDEERKERLETKDRNRSVAFFAQKARSAFYADAADAHALGTWEAYRAFADLSPAAATAWLNRLAPVSRSEVQRLLDQVPNKRMSTIAKSFTLELLEENMRRLLEGRGA